jgi:hypothetical protein
MMCVTVRMNNDTLYFVARDTIIDQWVLNEEVLAKDSLGITFVEKVKIAADSTRFLFYQEEYDRNSGASQSALHLYTAEKTSQWSTICHNSRRVQFNLCAIYGDLLIFADSDLDGKNTGIWMVKGGKATPLISPGQWLRVVRYVLSNDQCSILFHTQRLHCNRAWDFLYFRDINTGHDWEYFFPTCLSCKKTPITLCVEDNGQSEVIYKQEHRIFSKKGDLLKIFFDEQE